MSEVLNDFFEDCFLISFDTVFMMSNRCDPSHLKGASAFKMGIFNEMLMMVNR